MKAVVKTKRGEGNVEYMDYPEQDPGPGEVKVRVEAAGICGTDIHILHDEFLSLPPVVMGHEFSGCVVGLGPQVKRFGMGERVTAEVPAYACGSCLYCKTGSVNLCDNRRGVGWSVNGCFAEFIVVEEGQLHAIPDRLSYEEGALLEPLACCVHGVIELTDIKAGDTVYVSGPGPVGILTAQVAAAEGARVVVGGTSADSRRLELASGLGVHRTVDVEREDPIAILRDLTDGLGADVVVECAGAMPAIRKSIDIVRRGGLVTQIGLSGRSVELEIDKLVRKEVRLQGVFSANWRSWEYAIRLVEQGRVSLTPVISHRLPLSEWCEGLSMAERREGLKVLLMPGKQDLGKVSAGWGNGV
jgi:L-iditol 2-dehydrogenase